MLYYHAGGLNLSLFEISIIMEVMQHFISVETGFISVTPSGMTGGPLDFTQIY